MPRTEKLCPLALWLLNFPKQARSPFQKQSTMPTLWIADYRQPGHGRLA